MGDSAWILRVQTLRTGAESAVHYTNPYEEIPSLASGRRLVLDQGRLLWLSTRGRGMFDAADHVYTAPAAATTGRRLATEVHTDGAGGGYSTGIAGDSSGFSYGVVTVTVPGFDQGYQVSGGSIWSVVGGTARRVAGAPPAFVLSRAAVRVAIAPVDANEQSSVTCRPATTCRRCAESHVPLRATHDADPSQV